MSDFANSYKQKKWEFAVAAQSRYKNIIDILTRRGKGITVEYWQKKLNELETEYPQLKKDF